MIRLFVVCLILMATLLGSGEKSSAKRLPVSFASMASTTPQELSSANFEKTPWKDASIESRPLDPDSPESDGTWRLLGSLVVVLGLIYGFLKFGLPWFTTMGGREKTQTFGKAFLASTKLPMEERGARARFRLLTSQSLGAGKSLHLVEISGRRLVLGATAQHISLLTEFSESVTDVLPQEIEPEAASHGQVENRLPV